MKMQLLASFLFLLPQLASCMHTQPHFYGTPDQIWDNVFYEFKEQNALQGFYNPRQDESTKITFEQMLEANIWHPNNHENYGNAKTSINGVKTQFLTHFAGLKNLEYKQLYTYTSNLPKEPVCPVVGLKVRTVGIIKVREYCNETRETKDSYYLMDMYVTYDTVYWPYEDARNTYGERCAGRKVTMDEVVASIGWKEIKSTEMIFRQKEDKLNFVSICGKTDSELYHFNEHKTLEIAPLDYDMKMEAFFEGGFFTTAQNYFNLPVDNVDNSRHQYRTVKKYVSTIVMVLVVFTMIRMLRK